MLNVVVLPAPLGPRRAKIVSLATEMLTSSVILLWLNFLDTPDTSRRLVDDTEDPFSSASIFSKGGLRAGAVFNLDRGRLFKDARDIDPDPNQTRIEKSPIAYKIRYKMGPPSFVSDSSDFFPAKLVP